MAKLELRLQEQELKSLFAKLFVNTKEVGNKIHRVVSALRQRGYAIDIKDHYHNIYEKMVISHPQKTYKEICDEFDRLDVEKDAEVK